MQRWSKDKIHDIYLFISDIIYNYIYMYNNYIIINNILQKVQYNFENIIIYLLL